MRMFIRCDVYDRRVESQVVCVYTNCFNPTKPTFITRRHNPNLCVTFNNTQINKMGVSSGTSFALASISAVLIFSGMQMYKPWLISSQFHTIFGGYLGATFFFLIITACGNFETCIFGKTMQVKLPEVVMCLCMAIFSAGTIHRVSATTCLLFSLVALYYINKHSQKVYSTPPPPIAVQTTKKRK